MKKPLFLLLFALVTVAELLSVQIFAASDVIVAVAEAEDGKSLRQLEAGDVINVRIVLPEMDEVRKLQFDLNFNSAALEYNGDAKPDTNAAGFDIISVGEVTEEDTLSAIRFVAGASSPVTFSGGKNSFSASFTVKEDASEGQCEVFSLSGLNCDDESVSLFKSPVKITVVGAGSEEITNESEEITAESEDGRDIPAYAVPAAVICLAAAVVIAVVLAGVKVRRNAYK